jgi:MFS family permease
MNKTFKSFEYRSFRLFFTGQTISQVGNWMTQIALALFVLELTKDGVAVGFLVACQFLPVLLIGPWAGLLADRSDKRRLLLRTQSMAMLQSFALAGLATMDHPPIAGLYALAMVGGLATALDNPARRSFVVEMVPEEHVQNAVSLNTALMTGSRIFGPALAGLVIATAGYSWAFGIDAVSYIAVLWSLWRINSDDLRPAPPAARGKGQVREGIRYMRSVPELRISLVMMAIVGTLAFNFSVVLPIFVTRSLDGSPAQFTLLFSALSVGSMAAALWAARRSVIRLRHIVVDSFAYGGALLGLAAMPNLAAAFPVALFVGGSSVVFMTTSTTLLQLRATPSMRGRVLALQAMVFLGSTPIGGPILGWVCEHLGARAGLVVGGGACLAAGTYGLTAGRRLLARGGAVRDDQPVGDLQPA